MEDHRATDGGTLVEPTPPESLPKYLCEGVQKQDASTLRDLAAYAEAYANFLEAQAERELRADSVDEDVPDKWDDDEFEDHLNEAREKADISAGKSTLTVKTIDGRDYYYLQWREGDTITSQYVAPVTPAGDG